MQPQEFVTSLAQDSPPIGLSAPLAALWHAARDDWDAAHKIVQAQNDTDAAWVHAYLHRVEGDLGNAGYWYRRAGRAACTDTLQDEWHSIVAALLDAA